MISGSNSGGYRYMIGVLPEGKDKMTLHEVDLFRVKTSIPHIYDDLVSVDAEAAAMTFAERRAELIDNFSTVKKKRDLASKAAGRVSDEKMDDVAGAKANIQKRVLERGMGDSLADPAMAGMRELLPPFNPSATEAHLIYDWSGVVPASMFKTIDGSGFAVWFSERGKFVKARKNEDNEHYNGVLQICEMLSQHDLNGKLIRQQGKVLQIVHWLLDLHRFLFVTEEGARGPRGSAGVPDVETFKRAFSYGDNRVPSTDLCKYWMEKFKQSGEGEVTQFNKMRLLSYLFVFVLSHVPKV